MMNRTRMSKKQGARAQRKAEAAELACQQQKNWHLAVRSSDERPGREASSSIPSPSFSVDENDEDENRNNEDKDHFEQSDERASVEDDEEESHFLDSNCLDSADNGEL